LRLRARDGAFRAPARVTFFFCKKKVTKENHLNLRFKDPLARYGSCKIGGADLAELVRWVTLLSVQGSLVPLAPLPLTTARVGVGALDGLGDYQIAPKPPEGRLWLVAADAAGEIESTPAGGMGNPSPVSFADTFSCAHPSVITGAPSRGRLWEKKRKKDRRKGGPFLRYRFT